MLPLSPVLQSHARSLLEQWREHPEHLPLPEEASLAVLASSQFVTDSLLAFPQWWHEIEQNPPQSQEWQFYRQWLEASLTGVSDEAGLMKALRLFRTPDTHPHCLVAGGTNQRSERHAATAERACRVTDRQRPRLAV